MPNVDVTPRWLSQEAAAQYLGCSQRHIQALQQSGQIPVSYRLGTRSPRYDSVALDAWMEQGKQSSGTPAENPGVRLAIG